MPSASLYGPSWRRIQGPIRHNVGCEGQHGTRGTLFVIRQIRCQLDTISAITTTWNDSYYIAWYRIRPGSLRRVSRAASTSHRKAWNRKLCILLSPVQLAKLERSGSHRLGSYRFSHKSATYQQVSYSLFQVQVFRVSIRTFSVARGLAWVGSSDDYQGGDG